MVVLVVSAALVAPSWAQDAGGAAAPGRPAPIFGCRDKLRRGLANSATGWLEIPYTTFSEVVFGTRSPLERLFVGLTVGSGKAVQRTAVGVFETATFFIPSYDPIVQPEYVTLSFKSVTAPKEEAAENPRAGLHVQPPAPLKP
jgi:putative exosortase-associated protein (TIGR04073 family)